MDRESRINKIVEALLQESQISEATDVDFNSSSLSASASSSSDSNSQSEVPEEQQEEEETDEDEKLKDEEKRQLKKQQKKHINYQDPALKQNAKPTVVLDLTTQQLQENINSLPIPHISNEEQSKTHELSSSTTQQLLVNKQFKMTNDEFVNHLAVTAAWNKMTYQANLQKTQVAAQQQQIDIQNEQIKQRPDGVFWIRGETKAAVMQDYVEIILNNAQQARYVMDCVLKNINVDTFMKMPETQQLADDFDYKKIFDCYYRSIPMIINQQYVTFENVDNTDEPSSKTNMSLQNNKSKQNIQFSSIAADTDTCKACQTTLSVQMEDYLPIEPGHFLVTFQPAKRGYISQFYVFDNGKLRYDRINIMQQTDLVSKAFSMKQKVYDDTQTFFIIDKKYYDINEYDNDKLATIIKNCSSLQIIRGRGRTGKKYADLMERIHFIRPDLIQDYNNLYLSVRTKAQFSVEYKSQLQGTFKTMYGAYCENKPLDCEIIDNPLEPMFISQRLNAQPINLKVVDQSERQCEQQQALQSQGQSKNEQMRQMFQGAGSNSEALQNTQNAQNIDHVQSVQKVCVPQSHDTTVKPSKVVTSNNQYEIMQFQSGGEREPEVYQWFESPEKILHDNFKYHDPATGKGYNTISEFKAIREEFEQAQAAQLNLQNDKIEEIKVLLNNGETEKANELYQQQIHSIEPAYIDANYTSKGQSDTAGRILGACRYSVLE